MNKIFIGLISVLLLFAACGQQPQSNSNGPIKIGFIGPQTGDLASLGQSALRGIQLAVEEINQKGGINGRKLELVSEDGVCKGKEASNSANKLVNIDKVPAIVGGFCSPETLASAPIAEAGKVVLLSPTSSNPSITQAGDYVFRDYPSDSFQGKFAAEYLFNQMSKKKAAILYCLNDWCTGLKNTFRAQFEELGGQIVNEQSFEPDSKDLRTQLTQIKESRPEIIYFLGMTEGSIVGLQEIKDLGIAVPIIGGDSWSDPDIAKKAGASAEGMMWVEPYTPISDEFKNKIYTKFGEVEIGLGTPQAYDATYLIADAMKKMGPNGEKIKDALYQVKDYKGVSGTIGFDSNGDLLNAQYVVKKIQDGKAEEVYK